MSWDPHAFERCFRERYPELVQFLHGLTGDRAAGEDVAQEAFARLWSRGPRVRPRADYWLFKVARNLALDWIKTESRRNHRERLGPPSAAPPGFKGVDEEPDRTPTHGPASRDRVVLVLRALSAMSYDA